METSYSASAGSPRHTKISRELIQTHSGFWNKLMFDCQTDSKRE